MWDNNNCQNWIIFQKLVDDFWDFWKNSYSLSKYIWWDLLILFKYTLQLLFYARLVKYCIIENSNIKISKYTNTSRNTKGVEKVFSARENWASNKPRKVQRNYELSPCVIKNKAFSPRSKAHEKLRLDKDGYQNMLLKLMKIQRLEVCFYATLFGLFPPFILLTLLYFIEKEIKLRLRIKPQ